MGQFFNIWGNWNKFFEQHLDLLQQFFASIRFNQKKTGGGNNFLRAGSKKNYVPLKKFRHLQKIWSLRHDFLFICVILTLFSFSCSVQLGLTDAHNLSGSFKQRTSAMLLAFASPFLSHSLTFPLSIFAFSLSL